MPRFSSCPPPSSTKQRLVAPAIYGLADLDTLGPSSLARAVGRMARAGIGWIQLRMKGASGAEAWSLARDSADAVQGTGARVWIDDRADVAACLPASGVHVGQRDLPATAARQAVGDDVWVGVSTHDDDQLRAADADDAVDVIAVGPVFRTTSKRGPDPVIGLAGVRCARALTAKPLVAIGGIDASNAAAVRAAGADSIAVLGALCRGDVSSNARRLIAALEDAA